jgi:short-subunit dehydrogenase
MAGTLIVGAGPGIGAAVARRFAGEGMEIGLIARSSANLAALRAELEPRTRVLTAEADAGEEAELRAALDELTGELGVPEVLVYNAAVIRRDRPGELPLANLLGTLAVNVGGAVAAAAHIAPAMAERGSGTILITGGMPEPVADFSRL